MTPPCCISEIPSLFEDVLPIPAGSKSHPIFPAHFNSEIFCTAWLTRCLCTLTLEVLINWVVFPLGNTLEKGSDVKSYTEQLKMTLTPTPSLLPGRLCWCVEQGAWGSPGGNTSWRGWGPWCRQPGERRATRPSGCGGTRSSYWLHWWRGTSLGSRSSHRCHLKRRSQEFERDLAYALFRYYVCAEGTKDLLNCSLENFDIRNRSFNTSFQLVKEASQTDYRNSLF